MRGRDGHSPALPRGLLFQLREHRLEPLHGVAERGDVLGVDVLRVFQVAGHGDVHKGAGETVAERTAHVVAGAAHGVGDEGFHQASAFFGLTHGGPPFLLPNDSSARC